MTLKQKIITALLAIVTLLGGGKVMTLGSEVGQAPTFAVASSTVFSLSNSSTRLLATTTARRIAATIQPVNCTLTTGGLIYMKTNADAPATAATGLAAYASTTFAFSDYPNVPPVQGSVQGITAAGTCTVLVTEWLKR